MQRKDEIEVEIQALKDVLASHHSDMSTPLVDPEGYPRGDIDIYSIRHARSALARLTTDRATVTNRLSTALEAAFSPSAGPSRTDGHPETAPIPKQSRPEMDMPDEWPERPVARVNSVAPNSPALASGLRAGDTIFSFAGITSSAGGLGAIGSLVTRSENTPLTILILRDTERLRLRLTPRNGWGGRGMLGCHILPA
ncbi:26S proteasome regulatory subunit N4, partial [Tremellales sp. Uapishka_1]